jgi:hypothetical protein
MDTHARHAVATAGLRPIRPSSCFHNAVDKNIYAFGISIPQVLSREASEKGQKGNMISLLTVAC